MLRLHVITARMRHGTQGHVAEPSEPTRCLGGGKEARTHGKGHASPCGCPGGTTRQCEGWQVKGPRVSGPWWVYWGGNTRALFRPTFYTCMFFHFLSCGTMFPLDFSFARNVAALWTLDAITLIKGVLIVCTRVHAITRKARALKEI